MANERDQVVAEVGRAFLGAMPESVERVGGGRNSSVYRLQLGSECFALKIFPPRGNDMRDRLVVERDALQFMARHGIANVPRVLAVDVARASLLLTWITGRAIDQTAESDIDQAIAFLSAIHDLRRFEDARLQPLASEACLAAAEIVSQINGRIARLDRAVADNPTVGDFLDEELKPAFVTLVDRAKAGYQGARLDFAADLADTARSLCPSDFGFHNALRNQQGRLTFLDFDYFGWDDPAKLVSDFLLHPAMTLTMALKERFVEGAVGIYGGDRQFRTRLKMLFPLFGLRWCVILLNEFLPERWATRVHAGAGPDWGAAKERQLESAANLLHVLTSNGGCFPYGE